MLRDKWTTAAKAEYNHVILSGDAGGESQARLTATTDEAHSSRAARQRRRPCNCRLAPAQSQLDTIPGGLAVRADRGPGKKPFVIAWAAQAICAATDFERTAARKPWGRSNLEREAEEL